MKPTLGTCCFAFLFACGSTPPPVQPAAAGSGGLTSSAAPIAQSGAGASAAGGGGMPGDPPQGGAGGGPSMPAAGSGGVLEVTGDPDAWINFGGNLEQTFSPTSTMLNESNLMRVGLAAWSGEAEGGVTGTPAVYNGVVYWADWVGNVYAQNVTDGVAQWNRPVKLEHGVTSSPAVTERLVYLADRFNTVHALDRATGLEVWKNIVSDSPMAQLWSSPVVADGVLIVGIGCKGTADGTSGAFSPADLMMFRGAVVGLDAETGELRWRWENTIDAETGTIYGPGVSSWSSAAVDTTRKIAYIGTGNSYYPEASPYSDSLLALRYLTTNRKGELAWHSQFTMNDNYTTGNPTAGPDYDVGATPNLFSIGARDFVAVGDKGGRFYILDRETQQITFKKMFGKGSNRGGVMAPAAYALGMLYLTSNEGSNTVLAAVDASQGTLAWERRLMGVSYGAPLLLNDVLLVGTTNGFPSGRAQPGQIDAYRTSDGKQVDWSLGIDNQRGGGMSIYRDTLFIPYGYVFEDATAERSLKGGLLVAALDGKAGPGPKPPVEPTYAPTYTAVFDELLQAHGCTTPFCHGGTGLQLTDLATGYTNLMTGTSSDPNCAGVRFIVPGDPEQSYLYKKLQPNPKCGMQMPLNLDPLKPEFMTQIRTWIERGAKMD